MVETVLKDYNYLPGAEKRDMVVFKIVDGQQKFQWQNRGLIILPITLVLYRFFPVAVH